MEHTVVKLKISPNINCVKMRNVHPTKRMTIRVVSLVSNLWRHTVVDGYWLDINRYNEHELTRLIAILGKLL